MAGGFRGFGRASFSARNHAQRTLAAQPEPVGVFGQRLPAESSHDGLRGGETVV
jgi:hypothetical protein